jgi:hypothetical protein
VITVPLICKEKGAKNLVQINMSYGSLTFCAKISEIITKGREKNPIDPRNMNDERQTSGNQLYNVMSIPLSLQYA